MSENETTNTPANPHGGSWTDESVARLKVLKEGGHSAETIANILRAEFGGHFSRNSVLGKVHRMWGTTMQPKKQGGQAKTYMRKVTVGETPPPLALKKEAPPVPDTDGFLPVGEIAGAGQCHWIEGDPRWGKGGEGRYCGAPTGSVAKPYCEAHRALMWDKARTEKANRAARERAHKKRAA